MFPGSSKQEILLKKAIATLKDAISTSDLLT
jgi:hypothetical protein